MTNTPPTNRGSFGRSVLCRGFTLIELLATIAIASLIAAVATVGLSATSDQARLRGVASRWQNLDGRARLFARAEGSVMMTLTRDARAAELRVRGSDAVLSRVAFPEGLSGLIETDDQTDDRDGIVFSPLGRSRDYTIELRHPGGALRWRVAGLTGLINEETP